MKEKCLFSPIMLPSDALVTGHKPARQQPQGARVEKCRAWGRKRGALWHGCSVRAESCWSPVVTPSPAEVRRLEIRTDGWGRWSPAEAERGRIEETAGTSEVEAGEEREARQQFFSNFLERQRQTNSVGQLEGKRGREKRGEAKKTRIWSHLNFFFCRHKMFFSIQQQKPDVLL